MGICPESEYLSRYPIHPNRKPKEIHKVDWSTWVGRWLQSRRVVSHRPSWAGLATSWRHVESMQLYTLVIYWASYSRKTLVTLNIGKRSSFHRARNNPKQPILVPAQQPQFMQNRRVLPPQVRLIHHQLQETGVAAVEKGESLTRRKVSVLKIWRSLLQLNACFLFRMRFVNFLSGFLLH